MALAVKSAVRKSVKKMRISGDFWNGLDKSIMDLVSDAAARAKANGRKTIRGSDL